MRVEVLHGTVGPDGEFRSEPATVPLTPVGDGTYRGDLVLAAPGTYGVTARVIPVHPALASPVRPRPRHLGGLTRHGVLFGRVRTFADRRVGRNRSQRRPDRGSACRSVRLTCSDDHADIDERIAAVAEKSGFVPNVFTALAERPELFRAFFQFHDLRHGQGVAGAVEGRPRADRRRHLGGQPAARTAWSPTGRSCASATRIRRSPTSSPSTGARRRSTIAAGSCSTTPFAWPARPEDIGPADAEPLRAVGFTDDDIWDIAAIVGFFALSNRLAHAFDMRPNPEFFTWAAPGPER